ncbi:FHA domain-containing protein [Hyphomicrobium sp. CS1GBMeth3]|uniref:FHA domain-containing protein n=1 Tax=Hyphomicrobium sp. CS1GBMeth3 TaxID=1892845 RepID=UPI0009FA5768|nr:FHA domain-containing protein [Hyphomicrobium sp. CS1GBMeth3]
MRRPARQRKAIVAISVLLSALGPTGAAAETRLVAQCEASEPAAEGAPAAVACDLRASGLAAFENVKAAIKGEEGTLEAIFSPYDPATQVTTTAYLIQLLPNARRVTLAQMGDAVVTFTDQRQGKRRFAAYTFGTDLSLIADSGTSNAEFVRQMVAIKPATASIGLYKAAIEAIEKLAKESGDRKALVILGDGTSDDKDHTHEQVVQAARDANVAIHVLGYYDDRAARTKFQALSRLAEETGGYAAEVKQGAGAARDLTKEIVTTRFVGELLENGGTLTTGVKGAPGSRPLALTAELADGKSVASETEVVVPAAPLPSFETTTLQTPDPDPAPEATGALGWIADRAGLLLVLAGLIGLGAYGYRRYGHALMSRFHRDATDEQDPSEAESVAEKQAGPAAAPPVVVEKVASPPRKAETRPAIYGWLEALDGDTGSHPLRTENVRVGRLRDNDICLQNDSISRRHAVLHYDADKRRVVITDLGGSNGVLVNRTKYKSRELKDGDMVELGEVRLRFRAEPEYT